MGHVLVLNKNQDKPNNAMSNSHLDGVVFFVFFCLLVFFVFSALIFVVFLALFAAFFLLVIAIFAVFLRLFWKRKFEKP